MAYSANNESNYLYLFDMAYVVGNGAHFAALSLFDKGVPVKDEK